MCSGYGDLTADGLERGAAAGTAEILKKNNKRRQTLETTLRGFLSHYKCSLLNQCRISGALPQAIFSIFSQQCKVDAAGFTGGLL